MWHHCFRLTRRFNVGIFPYSNMSSINFWIQHQYYGASFVLPSQMKYVFSNIFSIQLEPSFCKPNTFFLATSFVISKIMSTIKNHCLQSNSQLLDFSSYQPSQHFYYTIPLPLWNYSSYFQTNINLFSRNISSNFNPQQTLEFSL